MPKPKAKPAPAPERFAYTNAERKAILSTLEPAPCARPPDTLIASIEMLARSALRRAASPPPPYAGPVRTELEGFATDVEKLLQNLEALSPDAQSMLAADISSITRTRVLLVGLLILVRDAAARQASTLHPAPTREELKKIFATYRERLPAETHATLNQVEEAALQSLKQRDSRRHPGGKQFPTRGRRPNTALAEFVCGLAFFYYDATGLLPTRRIDVGGRGSGLFHAFADACVRPAGLLLPAETVDHYVRLASGLFGLAKPLLPQDSRGMGKIPSLSPLFPM